MNPFGAQQPESGSSLETLADLRSALNTVMTLDSHVALTDGSYEFRGRLVIDSQQAFDHIYDRFIALAILKDPRILLLDEGWRVELGTHDELMALGGLYARLYRIQFKIEERIPVAVSIEPAFAAETPARKRRAGINILGQFTGS